MKTRLLSLMLVVVMIASCMAGCDSSKANEPAATNATNAATNATNAAANTASGEQESTVITVYMKDASSGTIGNYSNLKAIQAAEEKLGVDLQFVHPAVGSESDQFNLMIASGEYPDVIYWDFSATPMGLDQMIEAGVLINSDPYIREHAPNYLKVLEGREDFKKEATSNDGKLLAMYSFSGRDPISSGATIRGDLLAQTGLDIPTTIDEWTEVLNALKEVGVTYPLGASKDRSGVVWISEFMPAYKTSNSFCLDPDTGKLVYGPATENFRNYLRQMNAWYTAGLIDPEFMSDDMPALNNKISTGRCASATMLLSYQLGNIIPKAQKENPDFTLTACPWPVLNKGDKPEFFNAGGLYWSGTQAAITSACKNPEKVIEVLDYFFSDEGTNLLCWGIEGESYTVAADGTKSYTDAITKNPDKSAAEAIQEYAIPTFNFCNVMLPEPYLALTTRLPEQKAAFAIWNDAGCGVSLPKFSVQASQQSDFNMIMNDVDTTAQEYYLRFLTGQLNLDTDWDSYVSSLNGMGLKDALAMKQASYDLYSNR